MMNFLNSVAMKISMLGAPTERPTEGWKQKIWDAGTEYRWLIDVFDAINNFLYPLMYLVIVGGAVYAVILGVNLARAETTEKREEAKKRMIWAIIGIVSIFVLILLLNTLRDNLGSILG